MRPNQNTPEDYFWVHVIKETREQAKQGLRGERREAAQTQQPDGISFGRFFQNFPGILDANLPRSATQEVPPLFQIYRYRDILGVLLFDSKCDASPSVAQKSIISFFFSRHAD